MAENHADLRKRIRRFEEGQKDNSKKGQSLVIVIIKELVKMIRSWCGQLQLRPSNSATDRNWLPHTGKAKEGRKYLLLAWFWFGNVHNTALSGLQIKIQASISA